MTLRVRRFDSVTIGQPTETPQGFLRVPAVVSRVGVLEYPQADGKVWRELVTEDALFNTECMDSMAGIPYTDLHPLEAVTPENAKEHTRGHFADHAHKDGEDGLGTEIYITDADLISQIKGGQKREVSMGYFATLDRTPGTWKGQRYDAKQVHRIYNHGAAVPAGRAGHSVRLKMDSKSLELVEQEPLMKIQMDGIGEVEVTPEQAAAYAAQKATRAAANQDAAGAAASAKAIAEAQARADAAEAALKVKNDADAAKNTDAAKQAEVKARQDAIAAQVKLVAQAGKFIKDEAIIASLPSLDAAGVMKAAILATDPDAKAKLDSAELPYLQARFDILVEKGVTATGDGGLGKAILEGRSDGAEGDDKAKTVALADLHGEPSIARRSDAMQDRRHKDLENAWRKPLPKSAASR